MDSLMLKLDDTVNPLLAIIPIIYLICWHLILSKRWGAKWKRMLESKSQNNDISHLNVHLFKYKYLKIRLKYNIWVNLFIYLFYK